MSNVQRKTAISLKYIICALVLIVCQCIFVTDIHIKEIEENSFTAFYAESTELDADIISIEPEKLVFFDGGSRNVILYKADDKVTKTSFIPEITDMQSYILSSYEQEKLLAYFSVYPMKEIDEEIEYSYDVIFDVSDFYKTKYVAIDMDNGNAYCIYKGVCEMNVYKLHVDEEAMEFISNMYCIIQ